jgi:hypothetical protein
VFDGIIVLKPNLKKRIEATISLGQDKLWSFANLYGQLHRLECLVPRMVCSDLSTFALLIPCQTKASSRAWIDTFFFQASAMLPLNQHMVFNMEHIPSTTISSSSSVHQYSYKSLTGPHMTSYETI